MRAFEVSLNGENAADLFLSVRGLISPLDGTCFMDTSEAPSSRRRDSGQGCRGFDKPKRRYRRDRAKELRAKKNYVRAMARKLGGKLDSDRNNRLAKMHLYYATAPAAIAAASATTFPGPCPTDVASACSARLITSVTMSTGSNSCFTTASASPAEKTNG